MNKFERYEQIDHTADMGIKAFGRSLEALFSNAAYALFDQMVDLSRVKSKTSVDVEVAAEGLEDLLVRWLSELLFQFETTLTLFGEFDILNIEEHRLVGRAFGEQYDPSRHKIYTEVKAVTYHQLEVRRVGDLWQAQVIFDI